MNHCRRNKTILISRKVKSIIQLNHCIVVLLLVVQGFQTEGTLDDYLGQESLLIEFSRTMPNVFNMRILLKVDAEMLADENFLVRYCAPYNTIALHSILNRTKPYYMV